MTGKCFSIKSFLSIAAIVSSVAAIPPVARRGYDYVIVGGGPAGFVLAESLSRNPRTKVVLLEAGPDGLNSTLINTPAYYALITEYYWNYTAQPNPNTDGEQTGIGQGRVFGGGSAVNGMAYCRGASSVFDEWAELSGNPGLAWNSLLEDFREVSDYGVEAYADYEQFVNTTVYGDGPLKVSRNGGLTGFDIPFADALKSTFDIEDIDMTDGSGIGLDRGIASIHAGQRTRSYARVTFGTLMENRPNVQMIHSAEVSKIGFSGQTAVNVTYTDISKNKTFTIKAKEIIVSSGAINSPKLLMLSGVGPKAQLSELDIPVVADIPDIGSNLFDHVFAIVQLEVTAEVKTLWQWAVNATGKALAEEQYAANRSGPLGWNNGYTHAAFRLPDSVWDGMNGTHYIDSPSDRPHVLMEYTALGFIPGNVSAITAWISLVQPEASGKVVLNSSDYRNDPLIYTNYYGSEADKAAMIYGYKKLRDDVLGADGVKALTVKELYPGANVTSDENIWAAIKKQSYSFRHPVGTVAIGKALDSNWRIKGLQGIRVIDSSTFPTPPSCHPQADVYALAHRAAKDIRQAD